MTKTNFTARSLVDALTGGFVDQRNVDAVRKHFWTGDAAANDSQIFQRTEALIGRLIVFLKAQKVFNETTTSAKFVFEENVSYIEFQTLRGDIYRLTSMGLLGRSEFLKKKGRAWEELAVGTWNDVIDFVRT